MSDLKNEERRRDVRVDFETEVILRVGGIEVKADGSSRDLSLKGMFVKTADPLMTGTRCQVDVKLKGLGEEVALEMNGHVVRQEEGGIGILFDSVDLDSYVHLKNIVRFNAPDADKI